MQQETILVLNFGSEHSQRIAREVRDLKVYSEILPYTAPIERIKTLNPKGIIVTVDADNLSAEGADKYINQVYHLGIPTVIISEPCGDEIRDFIFGPCECSGTWTPSNFIQNSIDIIKEKVGDKRVLCALSGGLTVQWLLYYGTSHRGSIGLRFCGPWIIEEKRGR